MKKVISVITVLIGIILAGFGIVAKTKESMAISIIGGADGPTSIFLAGKLGYGFSIGAILLGIVFIIVGIVIYRVLKKK